MDISETIKNLLRLDTWAKVESISMSAIEANIDDLDERRAWATVLCIARQRQEELLEAGRKERGLT